MDFSAYPFASRRSAVLASRGVVATSQPLAAQAGLAMLRAGGNAVDAALATAATLTVVEPTSNGLGSDAFALVWDGARLHGLNGSGRWPGTAETSWLRAARGKVLELGWPAVTVPGAVDAWAALHERFGSLPVAQILQPAIEYAEGGFPVSPVIAQLWAHAVPVFVGRGRPDLADWAEVFAPHGRAPHAGERWHSPGHAHGLRTLAERGLRDFYEGELAEAIVSHACQTGGRISGDDLAGHRGEWVEPIGLSYGELDVWELPPNGQGIAALMALGIYQHAGAQRAPLMSEAGWHAQIEAMKLAFADAYARVADQQHSAVPVTGLLDPEYLAGRARLIGDRAGSPPVGNPVRGGTVYLCCADADGMMVSFIQSNYEGFGSGVVVPGYGIALQNRAACFVLDPQHPNVAAPGKRPRHTIIPGFVTRAGVGLGPFGVMGGEMQPQGHLQVIAGMVDHGLNPQAALDKPRWRVHRDHSVSVEAGVPEELLRGLARRGHTLRAGTSSAAFGRGQVILKTPEGVYVAGSEPRADGCAVGF